MQGTVGHYRIIEKVGEGGMGVVYKAEDTRLGRIVALKFLPPDLTRDQKAKERFILEARAASAIDHPNVCTIYEVDETPEGQMFIAMAYYDGDTLKVRIASGVMPLAEAMDIAAQVAKGLARAHTLGIVHRDIKPGNILLSRDGQVKIVDFGLAKLAGLLRLTSTGHTLGTVAYMSPEQGRGDAVGPASDIWSLGVVLYEMVTGQLPFRGDHEVAVLYAILNAQQTPVHLVRPGVPLELEHIVHKALAKQPADRYESLEDLLSDLDRLRRKLEIDRTATLPSWKYVGRRKTRKVALPPGSGRQRLRRLVWFGLAAVGTIVAGAGLFFLFRPPPSPAEVPWSTLPGQPRQVTSGDAWQGEPALSPDGTRIAYTSDAAGNLDIYIIDVRGGNPLRLTDDPAPDRSPAWFPDGTAIAFESGRGGTTGIWKVGQLGGGATLLLQNARDPAISPDGKRIAVSTRGPSGFYRIGVTSIAPPHRVTLLTGDADGLWTHRHPAWSLDGTTIGYNSLDDLWTVSADGGPTRQLTHSGLGDGHPAWSSQNGRLVFESKREGTLALWCFHSLDTQPLRLTLGSGHEHHPRLCRDGSRLAYATQEYHHALVLRNLQNGTEMKVPGIRDASLAALSPTGDRLVYASARGGGQVDLWLQPLLSGKPTGPPQRLTDAPGNASCPVFSPNGQWIAYYRIEGESRDVFIIPAAGGQPVRVTDDPAADTQPSWSPDGLRLVFSSGRGGRTGLWTIPVRQGRPAGPARQLTDGQVTALSSAWSADGARIVFVGNHGKGYEAWSVPADGSAPALRLTAGAGAFAVRGDPPTGASLVSGSWGEDHLSLRRLLATGGPPVPFEPPVEFGSLEASATFDVSRNGRYLVYAREDARGDIWVLEAAKGTY